MKYDRKRHTKTRNMDANWVENTYPKLALTKINIEYNGGFKFHRQYQPVIKEITRSTGSNSEYGAQLFIYMVELCRNRSAKGFKVNLDKSLFTNKKGNKSVVSYDSWMNTLQWMVDNGYGKLYIGDSHKVDGKIEYTSVFEFSDKSFDLVKEKDISKSPSPKFQQKKKESVVTTIKNGSAEEKVQVKGAIKKKQIVNQINEHNLKFVFKTEEGIQFDPQIYQKFSLYKDNERNNNLDMFESYGRYFGAFQSIDGEERLGITIDGEEVVELDYSSNHAFIAYEKLGIRCEGSFKPYLVEQDILHAPEGDVRAIFKVAMMMVFNSRRPSISLNNYFEDIRKKLSKAGSGSKLVKKWRDITLPNKQQCKAICEIVINHNKAIDEYFGGFANLLQNLDSSIAKEVMVILMKANIPFLCIHDSFIVPASKESQLRAAMKDAWAIVLGSKYNARVDKKRLDLGIGKEHCRELLPLGVYGPERYVARIYNYIRGNVPLI